ncbi:MAG: hypothetical protein U1A77_16225 [Pirellulales bacterium]|jgi:hypothetical protein
MTLDRTLPVTRPPVTVESSGGGPEETAGAGIQNIAQGFLDVARAAYDSCQHGKDATRELERRKNRSGQ